MVLSPPSSRLLNSRRPCDGLEPIRYHVPGPICHVSWKHHQVGRLDLVHQKQSYKIHWKKWPLSNVWGCEIWCFWRKKMDSCHWAIFPKILYYESAFWVDKFEITTMFSNKAVVDSYNLLFCKFATAKQTLWKHCLNWPKCWCHGFGKQKDDFKALVNLDKTNISNKMLSCKTQQEGKQFRKNAANSTAINSMWWPYLV